MPPYILLLRIFIVLFVAQTLSALNLLSSKWLASLLNFSLSGILNIAGVNNTWHKRMLTIDGKALYVEHEYILVISAMVFAVNLLWLQGEMNKKLLYMAGGTAILYLTHLLCYSVILLYTAPNCLFYCTEFAMIFLILHFYIKQALVKQPF